MAITRRASLQAGLGGLAIAFAGTETAAAAETPLKLGFLTVKSGPLAAGGIQMEQGLHLYLKEHGNKMGGREVQLFTADTGGIPANARTKAQELVEQDKVSVIIGPLAAFELLAIDDYTKAHKIPLMSVAAAEDITQRHPDPYFARCTSSSAQCSQVMGYHAAKVLKYKKMALIGDDIAYGQEQNAGFQRVFEDNGGEVVQKLWPPLNAPDYGTYIAQIRSDVDAVFMSFAGSNGLRFFKQYYEYGLGGKTPLLGGMTAVDEAILQQMGDQAIGMLSVSYYSSVLPYPANKVFVDDMRKTYKVDPGYYAAGTYVSAQVLDAALKSIGGRIDNHAAIIHAIRTGHFPNTARGPVSFDQFGNVVGNVYVLKVAKQGGQLVNAVEKTYPNVSQFWTYDPKWFLAQPVYSRNYPPARYLGK